MHIVKNKNHTIRNVLLPTLIALVIIIVGLLAYNQRSQHTSSSPSGDTNGINYRPATKEQQAAGTEAKKQQVSNQSIVTKGSTTLVITSVSYDDSILQIRAKINTQQTGGECRISMIKGNNEPVIQTVETQLLGSYSVCKGFDIETNTLESGDWTILITYTNEGIEQTTERLVEVR